MGYFSQPVPRFNYCAPQEQPPFVFDATHICDDATAEALLYHLVNYFVFQRLHVEFTSTYVGIHLIPGDLVTVTHPLLPAALSGAKFEVLRQRYNLHQGTITYEVREAPV
jgi:hypothetical protein